MTDFLIFQLYGAMAAWGDIAVGEQRSTTPHPSKSVVLGLIAAALGIRRDAEDEQQQLAASYGFAVRVEAAGVSLRDYHTTQAIKNTSRLKHLYTRYDELVDKDNISTILSSRDYRCDGFYTVCLWARDDSPFKELAELKTALREPVFTLYLGRKSCPLALPIMAEVMSTDTLETALKQFDAENQKKMSFLTAKGIVLDEARYCYWDENAPTQQQALHSTPRNDNPLSRKRRQFSKRTEYYGQFTGD